MKTAALLMYHGKGHFNAVFALARLLQTQFHVVFAGHAYFKDYVMRQGFVFYPLQTVPFGAGFENWSRKQAGGKATYRTNVADRFSNRLFSLRQKELMNFVDQANPQLLLIDSLQSTDFVVLYRQLVERKIRVAFVQTMLSTVIAKGPVSTGSQVTILQKKLTRAWNFVRFFGRDDVSIVQRQLRMESIPLQFHSIYTSLIGTTFANIPEFILMPAAFELPGYTPLDYQRHTAFLVDRKRLQDSDKRFAEREHMILSKKQSGIKIVYLSFGTVEQRKAIVLKNVINRVVNVCRRKNCVLVIASSVDGISSLDDNEHILVFHKVPQLRVLSYADLLITHGGLNSIKESISALVPMLVFPITSSPDVAGNAIRVAFHQLGLIAGTGDSDLILESKIDRLLKDEQFQFHLRRFHQIDKQYNHDDLLQQLASLPALP